MIILVHSVRDLLVTVDPLHHYQSLRTLLSLVIIQINTVSPLTKRKGGCGELKAYSTEREHSQPPTTRLKDTFWPETVLIKYVELQLLVTNII